MERRGAVDVGNVCGGGFSAWLAKCCNHTLPSPVQLRPFPSEEKGRDEGCLGSRDLSVSLY